MNTRNYPFRGGVTNKHTVVDSDKDNNIDNLIQSCANNKQYKRESATSQYDLTQPLWFDKIMQKIEKDKKKEYQQSIQKQLYYFQN